MTRLRRRPLSDSFSIIKQREKIEADPENTGALEMIEFYENVAEIKMKRESDLEWQKDNMEYDLRCSDMIAEKCKDDHYAQNLYASMCNQSWHKVTAESSQRWSCSWRYSGGIIADIREEGDYIDWYCSGIRDVDYEDEVNKKRDGRRYVSESTITEEIAEDLKTLGWSPVEDPDVGV